MGDKTSKYTAAPKVPAELQARYGAVLAVLSGQITVTEAAQRLDMPRNHFQTLMHRGLEGLLDGLTPGRPGRPAKPAKQAELEEEVGKLRKQVKQLEERVDMSNKLMGLASSLLHGTVRPRSKRRKADVAKTEEKKKDEEPGLLLSVARQLDEVGLSRNAAARALGVTESRLRRLACGAPRPRPTRARVAPTEVLAAAAKEVRELHGLVGADALRRAHAPLSRRQAACLKQATLTAMERERKRDAARVIVSAPGILRGFDAMDLGHGSRPRYVLVAADGRVPFRTTVTAVDRYDAESVARILDADFARHGAPLVLRMDRASCHRTEMVHGVCERHGVLVLHGPARCPCFYGQLERQNREHRAWLGADALHETAAVQARLAVMQDVLNGRVRRPSLRWQTAREVWSARPAIDAERTLFRACVADHAASLRASGATVTLADDVIQRRAIERALTELGYLRIQTRESPLGDRQWVNSPS